MAQLLSALTLLSEQRNHFPPTLIYNEGWLLRLFLDWFSRQRLPDHPLHFPPGSDWYSEVLLPSAFLPRKRGDSLGETWTHADGVVGHFEIGAGGKGDLSLLPDATHFVVLEAKLGSALAKGTTRVPFFDQAARNVACLAETRRRAGRKPEDMSRLGFYVIAPQERIEAAAFPEMERDSIQNKVARRVSQYEGKRDCWYRQWFLPAWERCSTGCLSWEKLLATVREHDSKAAAAIEDFYRRCCEVNLKQPGRGPSSL